MDDADAQIIFMSRRVCVCVRPRGNVYVCVFVMVFLASSNPLNGVDLNANVRHKRDGVFGTAQ